jgi:phosphatidylserine/phosphatidylglycerophosphate/cardiolipin synthase-like enzyme
LTSDGLPQVIARVAGKLPPTQVESLASCLERFPEFEAGVRTEAIRAVPTPMFAAQAVGLIDAWAARRSSVTGPGIATALRAAAAAAQTERARESIEIVWTGPRTGAVPVRLTREALLDVIRAANHELFVVSFAAYKVKDVVDALEDAADAGVKVRLVLESTLADGGALKFGAASAFKELRDKASFLIWPADKRPQLQEGKAALHAKAAVADGHTALVTSANLTGHAIRENMELGLLVRGGRVPERLASHFRELMSTGKLVEILL